MGKGYHFWGHLEIPLIIRRVMSFLVLLRLTWLSLFQARLSLSTALFGLYFHSGIEIGVGIVLGFLCLMLGNSNVAGYGQ